MTRPPRVLPLLVVGLTGIWVAVAAVVLLDILFESFLSDGWHLPTSGQAARIAGQLAILVVVCVVNRWAVRWWARNHAPPRADRAGAADPD